MTFTEASIPDLTGKVAVVTGANGGLQTSSLTQYPPPDRGTRR